MFFCDPSSPPRRNQARRAPGGWRKKKKINPRYRYGKVSSGANPNTDRRRKPLPRKRGPRGTQPTDLLLAAKTLRFVIHIIRHDMICLTRDVLLCA